MALQEEFESYRATAEAVAEAKDAELAKALEGNAALRQQLADAHAAQVPTTPNSGINIVTWKFYMVVSGGCKDWPGRAPF